MAMQVLIRRLDRAEVVRALEAVAMLVEITDPEPGLVLVRVTTADAAAHSAVQALADADAISQDVYAKRELVERQAAANEREAAERQAAASEWEAVSRAAAAPPDPKVEAAAQAAIEEERRRLVADRSVTSTPAAKPRGRSR